MMYLVLLLFACLAVFPAWGKDAAAEAAKYESCMKLAHSAPQKAFATALDWRSRGGAHPAEHCAAVALVGLKRYAEAAEKFETLAAGMEKGPPKLRAQVLDQAGQAWLLAGNAPRAYEALSDALRAAPGDPGLLTDRAEASAALGRYQDAVDDLSRALAKDGSRADALVYRASALRHLDHLDAALADIDHALRLVPNSPDALLERGDILRLKGDKDGARRDWIRVSLLAPGTPADSAAKANLERMDVKIVPGRGYPDPARPR